MMPADERDVSKIQFKDELKESIIQNKVNTQPEIAHFVKQNITPYMPIQTKEALFVLGYASQLFDEIQKGNFDKKIDKSRDKNTFFDKETIRFKIIF
ncbi:MAG: hypothetical protein J6V53_05120 [Alphaproteobacteria bacterium]|nr:hypothetical protein [Alphaproteobacteria bacterium]